MLPIVRAISNFTMSKPAKRHKKTPAEEFKLVKKRTQFDSSEGVMRFSPDILGRALARSWVDREFQTDFMLDPEDVRAMQFFATKSNDRIGTRGRHPSQSCGLRNNPLGQTQTPYVSATDHDGGEIICELLF